jgi:TPR repeat protein
MSLRFILQALCLAASVSFANAAVSLPGEQTIASLPSDTEGPVKEAMEAFQGGRHYKAVDLARPLAEKGNPEAQYLLGFAHETGQGAEASKDKAVEYYRKAAASKHRDAIYRLSFILLASDKATEREQARTQLEEAAKSDPAIAARILGEAYLRGRLTPTPDPDKAIFWWKRAADAGDNLSMSLIGRFYEGQFGFPELRDVKASLEYYAKAAGLGNSAAMVVIGSRYLNGDEKFRDEAKGREWLKKAIEAKDYTAYLALGDYEENVKKNFNQALVQYERGKDGGQMDCMLRSADYYIEGKGVSKDVDRGMSILKKAAELGSPIASYRLAANFLSAKKPDILSAYKYLLASANGNLPEAQSELGLLYLSGKMGEADPSAGISWLTRAAQNGLAQAQYNLAVIYERGAGGQARNIENAGQLYTLAANQGHGPSTLALARLINEGLGVKADPAKAWAIATLAAERGEKDATKFAADIAEKFDAKQFEQAKKELMNIKSDKPAPAKAAEPKSTPAAKD